MKKLNKNSWIVVITAIIILACISLFFAKTSDNTGMIERGKVVSIVRQIQTPTSEDPFPGQIVTVRVSSGKYKGQELESYKIFNGNPKFDIAVKPGQRVILSIEEDGGTLKSVTINDVAREWPLIILTLAFILTMVLMGGSKGLKSLLSLFFTLLVFFKVLLPLILNGFDPIIVTIGLSAIISAVILILTMGWQRRTLASLLAIIAATTFAGILALTFGRLAQLTGLGSAESLVLNFAQEYDLSFKGILFAAMVFGALGAMIEMAISISETVEQYYHSNPIATPKDLFISGVQQGKVLMGPISNVLTLAYAGAALPLMLILAGYQPSFFKIINLDIISSEIIRALIGSLGLFMVIPLTAAFCAWLIYEEVMLHYYP